MSILDIDHAPHTSRMLNLILHQAPKSLPVNGRVTEYQVNHESLPSAAHLSGGCKIAADCCISVLRQFSAVLTVYSGCCMVAATQRACIDRACSLNSYQFEEMASNDSCGDASDSTRCHH